MKLIDGLLRQWQNHTCNHQWVRARWEDGSYGLRCARCMTAYAHTWNEVMGTPTAAAPVALRVVAAATVLTKLHRAA